MQLKIIYTTIATILGMGITSLFAQEQRVLTYTNYLNNVKNCNVGYLVEKYNVDIAEANVTAAKIFPDPELSVSYSNNQNWDLQMGYGVEVELSYSLELGGKRKARMLVAKSEKEVASALLNDYFRNLRADATIAYLGALKQKKMYEIQWSSYKQMRELARADSIRFRLGYIMEVDARQSKLEAGTRLNDVHASAGDWQDALLHLLVLQGNKKMELPDTIAGELIFMKRDFDLPALIAAAQHNRADLQAALKSKELSQNNLRLAKANRVIDLGLTIGGGYASEVLNELAPAPEFKTISAGISIPLKFSNFNKGELRAAQLTLRQHEVQYEAVELQISAEVVQAFNKYQVACRQMEQFNTGLLDEAEIIFKKKAYSYERGETGMLDLLNAQHTYNDIQVTYIETLYNCAVSLVELERACGIWDILLN